MFRGRALPKVLLSLAIAALLLGDVFRGVHLLHTRHVVCPEHGELVDADEADARTGATNGRAEALPDTPGGHHHDHCGIAAVPSRLSRAVVAPAPTHVSASERGVACGTRCTRRLQGRAVLTYAPKQSPPPLSVA